MTNLITTVDGGVEGTINMTSVVSTAAQNGFANASRYDSHRPSYPLEAVDNVLKHLQVRNVPGAIIIDLGAGTGKFTELLAKRRENYEILAVEPQEPMRKELDRKNLRGVSITTGHAAHLPLESQSVDAVIATQVFSPPSHHEHRTTAWSPWSTTQNADEFRYSHSTGM